MRNNTFLRILLGLDAELRRRVWALLSRILTHRRAVWLLDIDVSLRHHEIVKEIRKTPLKRLSILDVGGRVNSLKPFLPEDKEVRLTVLNHCLSDLVSSEGFGVRAVQGDGARLPFKDNQFDIVTSITVLEHVPGESRRAHLKELYRVAKDRLLINIPLGPSGDVYERRLYALSLNDHIRHMTKQHIDNGLPTEDEIRGVFPWCAVRHIQNSRVWLTYMVLKQVPFAGIIFPRILFEVFLRFFNSRPPYYDALFVVDKQESPKEDHSV